MSMLTIERERESWWQRAGTWTLSLELWIWEEGSKICIKKWRVQQLFILDTLDTQRQSTNYFLCCCPQHTHPTFYGRLSERWMLIRTNNNSNNHLLSPLPLLNFFFFFFFLKSHERVNVIYRIYIYMYKHIYCRHIYMQCLWLSILLPKEVFGVNSQEKICVWYVWYTWWWEKKNFCSQKEAKKCHLKCWPFKIHPL